MSWSDNLSECFQLCKEEHLKDWRAFKETLLSFLPKSYSLDTVFSELGTTNRRKKMSLQDTDIFKQILVSKVIKLDPDIESIGLRR